MPGALGFALRKVSNRPGQAGSPGNLAARVGNGDAAAGFLEAEAEEGPEGIARRGADPVRVAAAGVEELGHIIAFGDLGELDQFVLQFERAEFEQRLLVGSGGGSFLWHKFEWSRLACEGGGRICASHDSSMMMIMPQIVSRVLPTA